jgi:hypothetical protein
LIVSEQFGFHHIGEVEVNLGESFGWYGIAGGGYQEGNEIVIIVYGRNGESTKVDKRV